MNQKILFMSDRHFGHTDIISLNERLFTSRKAMDLELIKQRNDKVISRNIVHHLNDIPLAKQRYF